MSIKAVAVGLAALGITHFSNCFLKVFMNRYAALRLFEAEILFLRLGGAVGKKIVAESPTSVLLFAKERECPKINLT